MTRISRSARLWAPLAAALVAGPALAHPGEHAGGALIAGVLHPLSGADHLLAMLCVGLWAMALGGRALWALPLGFGAAMAGGFGLALAGVALPLVEPMILASVVALGALVALAARLALPLAALLCAGFGLFHGAAHGVEMGAADPVAYLAGFVLATAALLGAGMALGAGLARGARVWGMRAAGGLVAGLGGLLALGV